jgi:antitoxin component YwqK of YwqJK toxin-antitoxin module
MKFVALIFCIAFLYISCNTPSADIGIEWSKTIKQKIIEDSSIASNHMKIDSSEGKYWNLEIYRDEIKTKQFRIHSITKDTLVSIYFSQDQNFELIRELCPTGEISFEGIRFKGVHIGLAEFHYCNGQLKEQGLRFNDEDVGFWKEWNEKGELVNEIDKGNAKLLNKLKGIKYYR